MVHPELTDWKKEHGECEFATVKENLERIAELGTQWISQYGERPRNRQPAALPYRCLVKGCAITIREVRFLVRHLMTVHKMVVGPCKV